MTIVTKTGDKGTTGLYGGARISKDDARMHAIGTVDELNAFIGTVLAEGHPGEEMKAALIAIQNHLFRVGADLATPLPGPANAMRVEPTHIAYLDALIGKIEPTLPQLQWFILPGGSTAGAHLHLARTVCRRAERWAVALKGHEEINDRLIVYLNRLSDLLFILARAVNRDEGLEETKVEY